MGRVPFPEHNQNTMLLVNYVTQTNLRIPYWRMCIAVSSENETLHPAGTRLKKKKKKENHSKYLQEIPEIDQIHQAPPSQSKHEKLSLSLRQAEL